MNTQLKVNVLPSLVLFGAVVSVGACAAQSEAPEVEDAPLPVTIVFDADNCPVSADPKELEIEGLKRVTWIAVDDSPQKKAIKRKDYYTIHFDPFKGRDFASDNDGEIKSKRINSDAPSSKEGVFYKYTILGLECDDKEKRALDPRFRLRS